jgi:hypothetical protein
MHSVLTAKEKKTIRAREWRAANPERAREANRKSREKHKEKRAEDNRRWYAANKERANERMRAWRAANLEKARDSVREWAGRPGNREKALAYGRAWREKNAEYCAIYRRERHLLNPEILGAQRAKRRASKANASPPWLSVEQLDDIRLIYRTARNLTNGILFPEREPDDYVVDHIIPLHGDLVCGLHVPWNLQILTFFENGSKGNYLPDDEHLVDLSAPGYGAAKPEVTSWP